MTPAPPTPPTAPCPLPLPLPREEGAVALQAICGIRFAAASLDRRAQARLSRLAARGGPPGATVARAPNGDWWIGREMLGPEPVPPAGREAERLLGAIAALPGRIRNHRSATPFGVWRVPATRSVAASNP